MAQTGAAHETSWIPSRLAALFGRSRLDGHIHLLASPSYRHIVRAEPLLRRSIPVLIVTFVAVLALTRLVGVMETRQALEDGARDETILVAATLAAQLGRPENRAIEGGLTEAARPIFSEVLPPRATANGRQILLADGEGTVVLTRPIDPSLEKRNLGEVFGPAQPLLTFGARAGVLSTTLTDGRQVLATVHHIDGGIGSVAVFQPEEAIFSDWRRSLRSNVTLFVFTAVILLVLTYAYFAQALRANSADALYALTSARTETAFKRGRCGFWDWDLARGRFYWSTSSGWAMRQISAKPISPAELSSPSISNIDADQ